MIGAQYGHLTVLSPAGRDKHNLMLYRCQCDCGNQNVVQKHFLFKHEDIRCVKCSPTAVGLKNKKVLVGKTINGWRVKREVSHENGIYTYECECVNCGTTSRKKAGAISASRTDRCINCKPNYHFAIKGAKAIGTLSDGTRFTIDKCMIDTVQAEYWRVHKDGYLIRSDRKKKNVPMHRWMLGITDPRIIVDHINRNRLDCRKSNLRIVTPRQNSCNQGMFTTNKTGYKGVYYANGAQRYEVKIGYYGRRIRLGSARNEAELIRLAQIYNIAASYLFGEYVGYLNKVPPPSSELVLEIQARCQQYKEKYESIEAFSKEGAFVVKGDIPHYEHTDESPTHRGGKAETSEI